MPFDRGWSRAKAEELFREQLRRGLRAYADHMIATLKNSVAEGAAVPGVKGRGVMKWHPDAIPGVRRPAGEYRRSTPEGMPPLNNTPLQMRTGEGIAALDYELIETSTEMGIAFGVRQPANKKYMYWHDITGIKQPTRGPEKGKWGVIFHPWFTPVFKRYSESLMSIIGTTGTGR